MFGMETRFGVPIMGTDVFLCVQCVTWYIRLWIRFVLRHGGQALAWGVDLIFSTGINVRWSNSQSPDLCLEQRLLSSTITRWQIIHDPIMYDVVLWGLGTVGLCHGGHLILKVSSLEKTSDEYVMLQISIIGLNICTLRWKQDVFLSWGTIGLFACYVIMNFASSAVDSLHVAMAVSLIWIGKVPCHMLSFSFLLGHNIVIIWAVL